MTDRRDRWRRMSPSRLTLLWLMLGVAAPAFAQLEPRLTGEVALNELAVARQDLAAPQNATPDSSLATVGRQLDDMADQLRRTLGKEAGKPAETMGDAQRAAVLRAHAAAARVKSYLDVAVGCRGSEAGAMQAALVAGVSRLAMNHESAKLVPVVDRVETMAHQPLFAVRQGSAAFSFALTGTNLADLQCADPKVTATDASGKLLPTQPMLTGVMPSRIEMNWPDAGTLPIGTVVLHVAAQHKVFLLGCTALPDASAVVEVAPPSRYEVEYTLSAICPASPSKDATGSVTLSHGNLPALVGYGSTVSQTIDTSACGDPQSYRLSAIVQDGNGSRASAGPFAQSAQASITAGLPGGLSLSWNPAAQILFVRSGAQTCKGIH